MTAKQYLEQVFDIRQRLMDLKLHEEELRTMVEGLKGIVYNKDKVQVSVENRHEDMFVDMLEVQEEYARTITELYQQIRIREQQISTLKPEHATVLSWRYLKHTGSGRQLTLRQISRKINYSFDRTRHLHTEALQAFEKKYGKEIGTQ